MTSLTAFTRRTQFKHEADIHPHRCKIYMLPNKIPNRIRVVVEFEKEINNGMQHQRVLYVVSDSGRSMVLILYFRVVG